MKNLRLGTNTLTFTLRRDHPFEVGLGEFYIMQFVSMDNRKTEVIDVNDQSPAPLSYQSFQVISTTGGTIPDESTVNLKPFGMWSCTIWTNRFLSGSPIHSCVLTSSE